MEILQHGMSGELYAVSYADGMTFDLLDRLVGPLTPQEAIEAIDSGTCNGEPDDIAWAKNQPWGPWQQEAMYRMVGSLPDDDRGGNVVDR